MEKSDSIALQVEGEEAENSPDLSKSVPTLNRSVSLNFSIGEDDLKCSPERNVTTDTDQYLILKEEEETCDEESGNKKRKRCLQSNNEHDMSDESADTGDVTIDQSLGIGDRPRRDEVDGNDIDITINKRNNCQRRPPRPRQTKSASLEKRTTRR